MPLCNYAILQLCDYAIMQYRYRKVNRKIGISVHSLPVVCFECKYRLMRTSKDVYTHMYVSLALTYVKVCLILRYNMIWYDTIWYDTIWYDLIWYDMIWYWFSYIAYVFKDPYVRVYTPRPKWMPLCKTLLYSTRVHGFSNKYMLKIGVQNCISILRRLNI